MAMKGNIHISIWASFFFFPFYVLFRKNWLNAPTGTRTHVSLSLVRHNNHYTTEKENPDGFLGGYAYSNEEKIGSQGLSTVITLYLETCYVASVVSPGGVVVIMPD